VVPASSDEHFHVDSRGGLVETLSSSSDRIFIRCTEVRPCKGTGMDQDDSSLEVIVLGTQSAKQRFPVEQHERQIDEDESAFAGWRCNLVCQSTPACAMCGQVLMHESTDWTVASTQSLLRSIQE
jgi:hypothetical protein